jgi:hypothetical protein
VLLSLKDVFRGTEESGLHLGLAEREAIIYLPAMTTAVLPGMKVLSLLVTWLYRPLGFKYLNPGSCNGSTYQSKLFPPIRGAEHCNRILEILPSVVS